MNLSASECSSGCESGWTMYLDQSSNSPDQSNKDYRYKAENVEDEDEDLSMVSDASSGPPHFQQDEDFFGEKGGFCYVSSASEEHENMRKQKKKIKEQRGKQQHLCLDDTASSPVPAKNQVALPTGGASMEHNLGYSQGFSATQFKGKSGLKKHFGFLQSSVSGKAAASGGKAGGLQGRRRE